MMKATQFRDGDHCAEFRHLYRSLLRCILAQGKMRAALMIVRKTGSENPAQGVFVDNDDMVQALAPDGSDQALDLRRLPW